MNDPSSFAAIFAELKDLLRRYAGALDCVHDESGHYRLNTRHIMKNGKPLFFAATRIGKNYVSFHLMPVYVFPELLSLLSPRLSKRMQGKSCFNFKQLDADLSAELAALTNAGFEKYKSADYV